MHSVCSLKVLYTLVGRPDPEVATKHDHKSAPETVGFRFGVSFFYAVLIAERQEEFL